MCKVLPLLHTISNIVSIEIHGGEIKPHSRTFQVDTKAKTSSQEVLFDFIAKSVAKFIKDKKLQNKLRVGFAFSFPVEQESLRSGKLIRWGKGYSVDGAKGKNVVQLLEEAFDRKVSVP